MHIVFLVLLTVFNPPDPSERLSILTSEHRLEHRTVSDEQTVDFLTYDIDVTVIPDSCYITGDVDMTVTPREEVDSLFIDLDVALNVDAVYVNGSKRIFSHDNDRISVPGIPVFAAGDTVVIGIHYHGFPVAGGFGSFICEPRNGIPQFWTLSQTDYARTWWPCHDTPSDKARVTVTVSVPYTPEMCFVVSNGILNDIQTGDGYTTYSWEEIHPIAPYLVSLAGTNYTKHAETVRSVGGDLIPVEYYVYPENEDAALEDLSVTPAMLTAFEEHYGPYPFPGEKYATALIARSGAMEHQTATSYGDVHIRGDHYFDWITAHELAHQWWGDWVTCDSWEHIWLNEGFASFSEALWAENIGGHDAYTEYMRSQDYLLTSGNEFPGTVLYPDYEFSITVYDKGAWIVHMLRQMLGDEVFFTALNEYGSAFAYSTVRTPDLVAVFETYAGMELQWFFDQWLLREGRPHLSLSWEQTRTVRGDSLHLRIEQVQNDLWYRFPLDLRFTGVAKDSLLSIEVTSGLEEFEVFMPFHVSTWSVDPRARILLTVDDGPGDPVRMDPVFTIYPPVPNPTAGSIHFGFDLPQPQTISVDIMDLAGRLIWKSGPQPAGAGSATITWPGIGPSGPSPSGVYIGVLRTDNTEHMFRIIRLK